ncbi:hypothetical protein D3C86_1725880 [compost metagenome]
MATHLLDVTFHHVHAHATPGHVSHLLSRRETRREDQHSHFFVGHVFVNRHALRKRFRQNTFTIQTRAVIGNFDADVPALMFCGENQVADRGFPRRNTVFRGFDTVVEAVTYQVR